MPHEGCFEGQLKMSPVGKSLGKNLPSESFREVGESVCCCRPMRATRWLVTGQAVAEVEHPPPPLLQVAATAPRRLKCLLRSESETPPHPHARRRLPRAACRLVLFSFLLLHVFFAVMSSAWRGEPPHPLSPSYSPRGVPPPGPPAVGDTVASWAY